MWSARNELIDREVAIKMMRPEAAANPVSLQRFFTEAKASGRLRHPNITEIFDLGQAEDGSPFLVLELLTGEPLDGILRRVPSLAPVQVLLLAKSIAAGLNVAHAKGIVHRDLKPANIYLHRDPVTLEIIPKVLDFGISKVTGPEAIDHHATHTGTVVGSPTYMSPEQARGVSDIDARADIWSVGVLMYKALSGRAPFNAANYNALMVAIMTEPHPPVTRFVPTVPKVVSDIVDDCLKKERQDRVQSAKALLQRIDSALLSLNAERARLELPSDDIDDDMPTIARGDRNDLLQLITATNTVAAVTPPGGGGPAPSVTPQPLVEASAPAAPQVQFGPSVEVASQPRAVHNMSMAATMPASSLTDNPFAPKKRGKGPIIAIVAVASVLFFGAVGFAATQLLGNSDGGDKGGATTAPAKADDEALDVKKKAKPEKTAKVVEQPDDKLDEKPEPAPTTKPSASATTTATATATAAATATATATAAAAPKPTATATAAPKPTAAPTPVSTPTPVPTSKPTSAPKPTPKPTSGTKVSGPGF